MERTKHLAWSYAKENHSNVWKSVAVRYYEHSLELGLVSRSRVSFFAMEGVTRLDYNNSVVHDWAARVLDT